jgi:hypothetical protein
MTSAPHPRVSVPKGYPAAIEQSTVPPARKITMNRSKQFFWQAAALVVLVLSCAPDHAAADQITVCVEPESGVANNVSRKRRSTRTDCDPAVAASRARRQSGVNARDVIAPICRERVSAAEAEATCARRGLALPSAATALGRPPIAAEGRPAADASLPVQSPGAKLCAVLRDVPGETETTTQPAGIENGFCLFNGNRTTTKVLRSRATCGVQCF